MKTNQYIIILGIITLILSCEPEIRFTEPQPAGKRNLNFIPEDYQGIYINQLDSSILRISEDLITQEWNKISRGSYEALKEELDSVFWHDTIIQYIENYVIEIKIDGDSATVYSHEIDTIFNRSAGKILRRYKDHVFINYREENLWKVKIISHENEYLDIRDLVSNSEIDSIKEIVRIDTIRNDSTREIKQFILNPDHKELKEILRRGKTTNTFKKI